MRSSSLSDSALVMVMILSSGPEFPPHAHRACCTHPRGGEPPAHHARLHPVVSVRPETSRHRATLRGRAWRDAKCGTCSGFPSQADIVSSVSMLARQLSDARCDSQVTGTVTDVPCDAARSLTISGRDSKAL